MRIYHGWRVVGAAFLVALFGWGLGFYGPGIYLVALSQRHGWSTAEIASAITAYYLLGAALTYFTGAVFERLGARRVVAGGILAMAAGVALMTQVAEPWQVYGAFAVMAFGWAAMSGAAISIVVAPWFERRRGLAVSLALNGASAGGVVMTPLLVLLLQRYGMSAALCTGVGLMLAVLLPVVLTVLRPMRAGERHGADAATPAAGAGGSDFRVAAALGSPRFHSIAIPFALGLTAQVGLLTHLVALLAPSLGTAAAGWAVSLTSVAAIVGRIGIGCFVDRLEPRVAAAGNFLLQIVGLVLLRAAGSDAAIYLGAALFGLGVGNMITLPALIVQKELPRRHFARAIGLVIAMSQFSFAFGPGLLGYLREASGDYGAALAACLAIEATAALVVSLPLLARRARR